MLFSMCLQLELQATGPSTPSIVVDEKGDVVDRRDDSSEPIQFVFEEIQWTSEISQQEAARRMEVTFYPFKKVKLHIKKVFIIGVKHLINTLSLVTAPPPGVVPALFSGLRSSQSREKAGSFHSALGSIRRPVLLR